MTQTLVRRGPDDAGYFHEPHIGLGMRRLSIIDLSGGRQPVFSNSGRFVAVFNGEIYNYRELQQELRGRGFSFRSNGDGEVLVNLYEAFGLEALNRLRGMFAVAIWDTLTRELLLVRDQLGIKPLFFSVNGDALLFGSEIKSILGALPGRRLVDAQALDALLAYTYIPAPLTIWKEIRKLRPGHFLKWREGRVSEHRYWDLLDADAIPAPSAEELRAAIDDSVRAHLVSDVEVGAFLSGGLDSSTIVARMQGQMESKIRAFSVRFATESHLFDETGYARELRDVYGFDLAVENLPSSDYESITDAIRAFDEPFADDSLMPSNAISAMAAKQLKVVLSGAGGDEVFGGYNRYQGVVLHERLAALPLWLRSGMMTPVLGACSTLLGVGARRGDLVRRFARDLHRTADDAYLAYITAAPEEVRGQMLDAEVRAAVDPAATAALIGEHQARSARLDPLKRAMYVDVNTYLPEDVLALADRIGMWHSLEIRTPFADRVLAEFAFRLPSDRLVNPRGKKIALREAVRGWLPHSILSHPKQGFEGPTASWLRGAGAESTRAAFLHHRDSKAPLINSEFLISLLARHVAGKADYAKRLFSALAVVEWGVLNEERIAGVG
ncbi:MAG: asparagine synthase (glutamine-hydrolyzing) [Burkholderiales bacterium]|jgi:asparagine synthase (glutamine-hydrolysing)|nr:asparagine synthase (glutamine-hydrolyzing) [Burkholderiales bacterium]